MSFETSQPSSQPCLQSTALSTTAEPPFPDDIPTAAISDISLEKLQAGDTTESQRLFRACCEYGFFHLDLQQSANSSQNSNDGPSLLDLLPSIFALNAELHNLPDTTKDSLTYGPPKQLFGHKAAGRNKVEDGNPDRYEAWTFARDDILSIPALSSTEIDTDESILPPPRPPLPSLAISYKPLLASYINAAHSIIDLICTHLDNHLSLPQSTLSNLQTPTLSSQTSLRLLHYPPHPPPTSLPTTPKSLVGHTDIGTITLLAENGIGGLQVLPPGKSVADENWAYVRPKPGCVVVNLGDAMVEWTAGILRSDLHRVVAAPGLQRTCTRYSIAYLVRPQNRAVMAPLKREWRGRWEDEDGMGEGEGKVWTALEWEVRKSQAIISGSDVAHSRGGIPVERYSR